jgi:hypothetical protein
MRDGIPRSLPVSKKLQAFIECADRPADRGTDRVVACLRDAIQDRARREFPVAVREEMKRLVTEAESFLPGFEIAGLSIADQAPNRHDLAEVLEHVREKLEGGENPRTAFINVIAERMEEDTAAQRRLITEDLASKISPSELKTLVSEVDRTIATVDFESEAESFLQQPTNTAHSAKPSIEPDEDLRGRP